MHNFEGSYNTTIKERNSYYFLNICKCIMCVCVCVSYVLMLFVLNEKEEEDYSAPASFNS